MGFIRRISAPLYAIASFACGGELVVPGEEQPVDSEQPNPSASVSTITAAPASVEAVTGSSNIIVTVRDESGDPIEGATVTLHGTGSGNTLLQPPGVTGPDGVATGTLSSTVPGVKVVSAVLDGAVEMSQTAEVTITDASAMTIELIAGNGQTGPVGQQLPAQPAVRVTNALGEPVPGYEVTFVVIAGGGRVDAVTQRTDSDGIARVYWVLGAAPGSNLLEARAGSLVGSPIVFTAQGIADDSGNGGGTGGGGTGGGGTGGGGTGGGGTGGGGTGGGGTGGGGTGGGGTDGGGTGGGGTGGGGTGGGGTGGGGTGGGGTGGGGTGGGGTGGGGTGGGAGGGPSEADIDRLVFSVQPPTEVDEDETFTVSVALVDANGNIVPLSGIFIYLDLFQQGDATPTNTLLRGEHFESTENGVSVFNVRVVDDGRYFRETDRYFLEAQTDDLPMHGPYGPEPYPRSNVFTVD